MAKKIWKYVYIGIYLTKDNHKWSEFKYIEWENFTWNNILFSYKKDCYIWDIYSIESEQEGLYCINATNESYTNTNEINIWRSTQWGIEQLYKDRQAKKKADKLDFEKMTIKEIKEECKNNNWFKQGFITYINNL